MPERVQSIQDSVNRQLQSAREARDRRRVAAWKDVAKRVARLQARGFVVIEEAASLPSPDQLVAARRFYPEQLQGLKEVRFTFSMEALPVPISQLLEDEVTKPLFGYISESEKMRAIVPVAREVAVNPDRKQLFLAGSENLSFDDQRQRLEDFVGKLRKQHLRTGTLEGVDFAMDHTSVYAQLDFGYQKRPDGRKLIVGAFARTIDETYFDETFGSRLAYVGRNYDSNLLYVRDWFGRRGDPYVQVVPVATPAGNR